MTRKIFTASMVVAALLLSVMSFGGLTADAQGKATCGYHDTDTVCADAAKYPGPFTNMPSTPGGPYGFGTSSPAAAAAPAAAPAAAAGTGGGLAQTGSESAVLAYAGAGLIAFGAVALGSRRKFFQGTLEA
jgi:LPXTG-motif cell wall-anchored protein